MIKGCPSGRARRVLQGPLVAMVIVTLRPCIALWMIFGDRALLNYNYDQQGVYCPATANYFSSSANFLRVLSFFPTEDFILPPLSLLYSCAQTGSAAWLYTKEGRKFAFGE